MSRHGVDCWYFLVLCMRSNGVASQGSDSDGMKPGGLDEKIIKVDLDCTFISRANVFDAQAKYPTSYFQEFKVFLLLRAMSDH